MKYILFVLLTFFAIFASANLNWVREIEDTATATDGAGPQFVVTLDGTQVSLGQLALMRNGYIHGLDSDGATVSGMTGEAVWNPLNFLGAAGWEFEVHYSPDGVKEYASSSATYTFIASDTNQYSIAFVSSDEVIPPATDCEEPTTAGYDFSGVSGSEAEASFSITGVACDTGYSGTATATVCSAAGQDYSVSGCTEDPTDVACAGTWSAYSACSGGSQSKTFQITTAQSGSGAACPASPESQSCGDCVGAYGEFGTCSGGTQTRSYEVTTPKTGDGTSDCEVPDGTPQNQGCGHIGFTCSQDSECVDGNCDGGKCVEDCNIGADGLVTNFGGEGCRCAVDGLHKTSSVACVATCTVVDGLVTDAPCECSIDSLVKTSNSDACVAIVTQTLDLQVGWNWNTVSIQLSDMTIASVLTSPEDGDRVLCQDSDSTYYSGYGWYSPSGLSEFTVGQGCKIKVATAKSIVLQGTVKLSVDYALNTGYTWVSISHDPPSLSVDQFLAGTFVDGDKIKVDASTELTYDGSAWSSAHNFALGDTIKIMKITGGSFTHSA